MPETLSFIDAGIKADSPVYLVECVTPAQNKVFRDTINKYHSYVRYTDSPTRNIRWLVYETESGNQIGAVGLSSATIAIKCRDDYIGWDKEQRLRNLGMLANNSRCCFIKDNITIRNAGSMVLRQIRIVGAKRWKEKYNQPLIMLETFVRPDRDEEYNGQKLRNGSIYLADNWIDVGRTSGVSIQKGPLGLWCKERGIRGELARTNPKAALEKYGYEDGKEYIITKSQPKIMFIKPLIKNWKKKLTEKYECRSVETIVGSVCS